MNNPIRFIYESHNNMGTQEKQRDAVFQAARRQLPHVVAWISPQGNAPSGWFCPWRLPPGNC